MRHGLDLDQHVGAEKTRDLDEPPALSLNLFRRLAAAGLTPGARLTVPVFDPATAAVTRALVSRSIESSSSISLVSSSA